MSLIDKFIWHSCHLLTITYLVGQCLCDRMFVRLFLCVTGIVTMKLKFELRTNAELDAAINDIGMYV
jgi:hypothetical protein